MGEASLEKSRILEPVQAFLGFDVEHAADDELDSLTHKELLALAESIDEVLKDEWQRIPASGHTTPVPLTEWFGHPEREGRNLPARLCLLNRQVLLPLNTFAAPLFPTGRRAKRGRVRPTRDEVHALLTHLIHWLRDNASLIRNGAMFPFSHHVFDTVSLHKLSEKVASVVKVKGLKLHKHPAFQDLLEWCFRKAEEEGESVGFVFKDMIRHMLGELYSDLFCVRRWHSTPAFVDQADWVAWRRLAKVGVYSQLESIGEAKASHTISTLTLPKLSQMPTEEIVTLHSQAESFALWRERLSVVLRNCECRISQGEDGDKVLKEEIWPLKDLVGQLEKEINAPSLAKFVNKAVETMKIGALALLLGVPIMDFLKVDPGLTKEMVKLVPSAVIPLLWPILFGKPKDKERSIVNMYHAVF